jgi:hypothetical protein
MSRALSSGNTNVRAIVGSQIQPTTQVANRGQPGRNVRQKAGPNRGVLGNAPYERHRQLAYEAPRFGPAVCGSRGGSQPPM